MNKLILKLALMIFFVSFASESFGCDNCIAKAKAKILAGAGRVFHPGGSMGTGRFEGCGFSTVSADHAVRSCCFWGKKTPVGIGVVRGARGWFATVLYR